MYIVVKSYFQKAASEVHDFFLIHAVGIYLYVIFRFVDNCFNFVKKMKNTDKMQKKFSHLIILNILFNHIIHQLYMYKQNMTERKLFMLFAYKFIITYNKK